MYRNVLVITRGTEREPALARALRSLPAKAAVTVLDVVHESVLDGYLGHAELYQPLRERLVAERQIELHSVLEQLGFRGPAKAIWGHPRDDAVVAEALALGADLVVTAPSAPDGGLAPSDWRLVAKCPLPVLVVRSDGESRYRRIVAAVDPFHAHAKPAALDAAILAHAKAMQHASGAALTALHCRVPLPPLGAGLGPTADAAGEAADLAVRQKALAELLEASDVPAAAARVETGLPHEVLGGLAESGEADLIVMGVLARGRLRELIVGHTAERVLHRGRVDVLVVKSAVS